MPDAFTVFKMMMMKTSNRVGGDRGASLQYLLLSTLILFCHLSFATTELTLEQNF